MKNSDLPKLPKQFQIHDEKEMFSLFYVLSKYLKEYENMTALRKKDNQLLINGLEDVNKPATYVISSVLGGTIVFGIPFLIIFYIVTNVVHLGDGRSLYYVYDTFIENIPVVNRFLTWLSDFHGESIILLLLHLLFVLVLWYTLVPCITVLMPAMAVISLFQLKKIKKSIPKLRDEVRELDKYISELEKEMDFAITFVPPDYRTSEALEFFCNDFANGKVTNLKEAMKEYDLYCHRKSVEETQKKAASEQTRLLQEQNEILKNLKIRVKRW